MQRGGSIHRGLCSVLPTCRPVLPCMSSLRTQAHPHARRSYRPFTDKGAEAHTEPGSLGGMGSPTGRSNPEVTPSRQALPAGPTLKLKERQPAPGCRPPASGSAVRSSVPSFCSQGYGRSWVPEEPSEIGWGTGNHPPVRPTLKAHREPSAPGSAHKRLPELSHAHSAGLKHTLMGLAVSAILRGQAPVLLAGQAVIAQATGSGAGFEMQKTEVDYVRQK